MAGKEVLFKSEEPKSRKEVADFLRLLAERVEKGEVVLKRGTESVTVPLPEHVILELKVEEKIKPSKTKRSLEIEIEWGEGEGEGPVSLG